MTSRASNGLHVSTTSPVLAVRRDADRDAVNDPFEPKLPASVFLADVGTDRQDVCGRLHALLEIPGGQVIECDVPGILDVDLGTLDCLARLTLEARRRGREVRFSNVSRELRDLFAFVGLGAVLPCVDDESVPGPLSSDRDSAP